jgi:HK97 family phage major capsid protein
MVALHEDTNMTPKELREKRAALAKQIRELAEKANKENRDFTAEEKPSWEKVNKDYDDYSRQIEIAERAEKVNADQGTRADDGGELPGRENRSGKQGADNGDDRRDPEHRVGGGGRADQPTEEDRCLAIQGWMRHQAGEDLEDKHREAAKRCGINPRRRSLDLRLNNTQEERAIRRAVREGRALSAVAGPTGAITIADTFVNRLEVAMLAYGGVRQVAEVLRTDTGAEMTWPGVDDTSNEGERIGENTDVAEQDVAFHGYTWKAYKYSSKLIRVPVELLEDSAFNLVQTLGDIVGERLSRKQNRDFTVGTAANQPNGIVTAATLGKTTAGANAITADEVLDLIHSVDPAYRIGAGFMFHDAVLLALRKLKDSQGRYLWSSGITGGAPDRLSEYPITINQHMASSVATTNKTMLFGQLNKYKVRDVRVIRFRRLVERYAEKDQEGFIAFSRSDGNLLATGTPVKYMQQT